MFPIPFAIIDTETTGMTATADRITEIAILTVMNGEIVNEWSTLINPECAIPIEIQWLTGINPDMLRDQPKFRDVAAEVHRRLSGHVFVAHNARFDYGFIKNEFRRVSMAFTAEVLCTVRLSRRLYPSERSHSLDALRDRYLLNYADRHRALGDARAVQQFMGVVKRDHPIEDIASAIKTLLKMPSLPPQLLPGALDGLPEGPGVYIFYGINNLPIYIGKGNNIRSRVRSHFSSDHRSANDQRLSVEIMRIDYEETAGELGALLREAHLVKTLMPLRNHKLRRNKSLVFIRLIALTKPIEILKATEVDFTQQSGLYGPFTTKASAKAAIEAIATEHGLCAHATEVKHQKKLAGPCFNYQLKKCKGYCVGHESLLQHNLRLLTGLAEYRFAAWPFDGAVRLHETHLEHGWEHVHVFENWLYRGTAKNEAEMGDLMTTMAIITTSIVDTEFDADIYKILLKRLRQGTQGIQGIHAARVAQEKHSYAFDTAEYVQPADDDLVEPAG